MAPPAILTPRSEEDIDRLIAFCQLVHTQDHPDTFAPFLRRNPFIPRESHFFIEADGRIAAMTSLLPRRQYLGGQPLAVGEIGLVGTHPDDRGLGLARQLLEYLLAASSLPLFYLYGIPHFYERFGFAYAVPSTHARIEMETRLLEAVPPPQGRYRLRDYQAKDLEAVALRYEQAYRGNPCAIVRSPEYWQYCLGQLLSPRRPLQCILSMRGTVEGYVWWELEPQVKILEAVSAAPEMSRLILREGYRRLKLAGQAVLPIQVPQDHALARHAHELGARFYAANGLYYGVWAGMYRLRELPAVLRHLLPALEIRLGQSRFYDYTGEWQLQAGGQAVLLQIRQGRLVLAEPDQALPAFEVPLEALTPWLTGYRSVSGQADRLTWPPELVALMAVLFPEGFPFISEIDSVDELG